MNSRKSSSCNFEWDPDKRRINLQKHGVDFADAALIFENPVAEVKDYDNSTDEIRYKAVGRVDNDFYFVVYTWREKRRRIISARKAGKRDRAKYQELLAQRAEGDA